MQRGAVLTEELPRTTKKFKFKDFLKLINDVNPKKSIFILGMLLSLITSGASLIVPQLTKGLVDTSQLSHIDAKMLVVLILAFAIQLGFGTIGGFLLRYVGESSVKTLREKLWNHLLKLPVGYLMIINLVKVVLDWLMILV
jgi:ABC-type multidrug transport system, ATPase and permease components